MPKKFERKNGFYCELSADQIRDNSIRLGDLHYDQITKDQPANLYFVYYDGSDKNVMERLYATASLSHYQYEHLDDIKWCEENKDYLQPLIKKDFDDKYGKYGEDFKFDLDIFNYAFLGREDEMMILSPNAEQKKKKALIDTANATIDKMMSDAAEQNIDLDLKTAINNMSATLANMDHMASERGCKRAMKLAMANYAHKIMKLNIGKEEKKKLFGEILISYKDTMTTMLATIGGYGKGYSVGNIDFGCLKANDLIGDLSEVVPTEFFIDVDKGADKNKDLDTVIKNSIDNKKIAVDDKEFIGETYKITKEKFDKHNDFVKWLSNIPFLYPSIKKERETIKKIEEFADKFDLGKTAKERIDNLTGITNAKKTKVIADMANEFVNKADIDVNNLINTMQKVVGSKALTDSKLRSLNSSQKHIYNPIMNRFYAGKVLDKISELPGVSEHYKSIDKEENRAFTKNVVYKRNIIENPGKLTTVNEYDQVAYKYRQLCEICERESTIVSLNTKCVQEGKPVVFSLKEVVEKADANLNKLNCDVVMTGSEINVEENYVEDQKDFNDLSNLGKDSSSSEYVQTSEISSSSSSKEKEETIDDKNISIKM